jgi:hypothetical protein
MKRITNLAMAVVIGALTSAGPGLVPGAYADTPTQIEQLEKQIAQGGERLKQLRKDLSNADMDLQRHEARGDLSGQELRDRRRNADRMRKEIDDLQQALNAQRGELSSLRTAWSTAKPGYERWKADMQAEDKAFRDGIDQRIQDLKDRHALEDEVLRGNQRLLGLRARLGELVLDQARLTAAGVTDGRRTAVDADVARTINDIKDLERSLADKRADYERLGGNGKTLEARTRTSLPVMPPPAAPKPAVPDSPQPESAAPAATDDADNLTPEERQARDDELQRFGEEGDRRNGFGDTPLTCLPPRLDPDAEMAALIEQAGRIRAEGGYATYDPFGGRLTYSRDQILKAEAMRVLGGRDGYARWLQWLADRGELGKYGSEAEASAQLLRALRQQEQPVSRQTAVTGPAIMPGQTALPGAMSSSTGTTALGAGASTGNGGSIGTSGLLLRANPLLSTIGTGEPAVTDRRIDTGVAPLGGGLLQPGPVPDRGNVKIDASKIGGSRLEPSVGSLAGPNVKPGAGAALGGGLQNGRAPVLNQQITPGVRRAPTGAPLLLQGQ